MRRFDSYSINGRYHFFLSYLERENVKLYDYGCAALLSVADFSFLIFNPDGRKEENIDFLIEKAKPQIIYSPLSDIKPFLPSLSCYDISVSNLLRITGNFRVDENDISISKLYSGKEMKSLYSLEKICFEEDEDEKAYTKRKMDLLKRSDYMIYAIKETDEIISSITIHGSLIFSAMTKPEYRGRGLCTSLLKKASFMHFQKNSSPLFLFSDYNIQDNVYMKAGFENLGEFVKARRKQR